VGQARHAVGHHGARWVRAIEIRPETLKGRRITHHAIAYLQQEEPGAQNNSFLPAPFMEWAVGKQGEMMRPDTGKLLLPGSKFQWDIHYSQAGEEITNTVEMGISSIERQEPNIARRCRSCRQRRHDGPASEHGVCGRGIHGPERSRSHRKLPGARHLRGKAMMLKLLPSGQTR
jgi:hypothetical protein